MYPATTRKTPRIPACTYLAMARVVEFTKIAIITVLNSSATSCLLGKPSEA